MKKKGSKIGFWKEKLSVNYCLKYYYRFREWILCKHKIETLPVTK